MHDLIEMNMEMAKRLKALRTSYDGHGLSHEKLRQAIADKYHVDISKSSLLNYEAYGNHSKAKSNAGMKVEYLRIFADFYGVSADYILGIRDEATTDVGAQATCEYTGLSEESVSKLHELKDMCIVQIDFENSTDTDLKHEIIHKGVNETGLIDKIILSGIDSMTDYAMDYIASKEKYDRLKEEWDNAPDKTQHRYKIDSAEDAMISAQYKFELACRRLFKEMTGDE